MVSGSQAGRSTRGNDIHAAGVRKGELLRRGVGRAGVGAAAHLGLDARFLGGSCGFALRAMVSALLIVSIVVERIALWMLARFYSVAVWMVKTLVEMLDRVGAS